MNINKRITSITITTRRRDVVYKRTPSDVTNHNCVVPATYRAPSVQCCGPLPVKKPATKKATKVTWRSLITPLWLIANVCCRRLDAPDVVNLTIVVLSRWSQVVTCLTFVLKLLLLQTSLPVNAVLLHRPSHLIRSVWRSLPLAHFHQPAVVVRPFYCSSSEFFSEIGDLTYRIFFFITIRLSGASPESICHVICRALLCEHTKPFALATENCGESCQTDWIPFILIAVFSFEASMDIPADEDFSTDKVPCSVRPGDGRLSFSRRRPPLPRFGQHRSV